MCEPNLLETQEWYRDTARFFGFDVVAGHQTDCSTDVEKDHTEISLPPKMGKHKQNNTKRFFGQSNGCDLISAH